MNCQNCARHVTDAIQSVPGVRSASVMLEDGRATVRWDSGAQPDVPAIIAAVKAAGYEAKEVQPGSTTELLVSGMTCQNCVRHVTEAIQSVAGIRSAAVSLEAGRASVRWNANTTANVPAVLSAIAAAGYEAKPVEAAAHDHGEHRQSRWRWNLILGIVVTGALMLGEWVFGLAMMPWFQWLSFALAGAVQIFAGAQFYRGAWNQLKIGGSNMDTLVALGSTTAFGYSTWALLAGAGGHVYFMEAAAIITLISTGHWLEARVSNRASSALNSLLNLAPQIARRIESRRSRGNEALTEQSANGNRQSAKDQRLLTSSPTDDVEVPVSDLKIGDLVALKPGDRVPVDGMVVEGDSAVDEAMLTGESVPVDKKTGSELYTGTVNLNGQLVMRVTATGEATALANIIAAVQRAQTSRADIQRLGDRVSSVFVPVVVAIAIAAGLWWGLAPEAAGEIHDALAQFLWHVHAPAGVAAGFIIAAAVLIIACPCAMGLATPAAIMAGANAAARRGILIRDGVALEKAGKITAVVFDKTGTLTAGKPTVAQVWENSQSAICNPRFLAASLARHSTHPISQAIAIISTEVIELADWKEIRGCGVEAKLPPSTARLGSLRWLKESGVDLAAGEKFIAEWSRQGATIVGLAADKTLLGLFAVRDTVKPSAARVIAQLQQQRLKTCLVTGDNSLTAAHHREASRHCSGKCVGRGAAGAEGGIREKTPGAGRARGVRGRRHQRRAGAHAGRPRHRREPCQRHRARGGGHHPAEIGNRGRAGGAGAGAGDFADHQTKPVLGVFLQRARGAAGRVGLHQPDFLCRGHGSVRLDRDRQRATFTALASGELMTGRLEK